MSNILEALRKAQSEQKTATVETGSKTEPLFTQRHGRSPANRNRRSIIITACGAVILLLAALLLYPPGQKTTKQQGNSIAGSTPSTTPTAAPPTKSTTLEPAVPPPPPAAPPVPQSTVAATPKVAETVKEQNNTLLKQDTEEAGLKSYRSKQHKMLEERPVQTKPAIYGEPEGVKLAGIAWQQNRNLRRAVINDNLIGEGAVVNGATVVEIKQTAVRFEKGGMLYEATLPR